MPKMSNFLDDVTEMTVISTGFRVYSIAHFGEFDSGGDAR